MSTFKDASKLNWNSDNTARHINAGSFQRIADALEKMSGNYHDLINERNRAVESRDYWRKVSELNSRRVSALKGVITKLKAK